MCLYLIALNFVIGRPWCESVWICIRLAMWIRIWNYMKRIWMINSASFRTCGHFSTILFPFFFSPFSFDVARFFQPYDFFLCLLDFFIWHFSFFSVFFSDLIVFPPLFPRINFSLFSLLSPFSFLLLFPFGPFLTNFDTSLPVFFCHFLVCLSVFSVCEPFPSIVPPISSVSSPFSMVYLTVSVLNSFHCLFLLSSVILSFPPFLFSFALLPFNPLF
jgi:hypothetical protein